MGSLKFSMFPADFYFKLFFLGYVYYLRDEKIRSAVIVPYQGNIKGN